MDEKTRSGANKNNRNTNYNNHNYNNQSANTKTRTTVSVPKPAKASHDGTTAKKTRKPTGFFKKIRKNGPTIELVRYREGVDRLYLLLVILLLCLGTVMIFSASFANALQNYGDSYFFAKKQIMMAGLGVVGMIVMSYIADYRYLEKFAVPIFIGTLFLNYLTPFFGKITNGAPRWFRVPLIGQIQPSELLKLAVVILFAYYMTKKEDKMKKITWGMGVPFLIILSIGGALFMQKHLSGLIIIALLCIAMMLIGEAPAIFFWLSGAAAGLGIFTIINFNEKVIEILNKIGMEHAGKRLEVWKDPFIDPRGAGYQIIQSLFAIGSGGLTGLGWGQSRQKYLWLPEPQNDYIFAILCEEMGFIGAILVIALFVLLIWRGFVIAFHAPNKFSSLVVMGITIKVALQFLLNIAVVTNILPATGIPLPFFSYGGTALIVLMAEMGIVLSISRYSYQEKP